MARSAILNIMIQAALKAGRSLARDYIDGKNLQFSRKGPANYVSQADKKAEDIIKTSLLAAKPHYSFLCEESQEIIGQDSQHQFIIDPLDGTTNFLHSVPHFAISIALKSQNEIVASVIYNPMSDELFTAEKGIGAFLNDRRIRVSKIHNLEDSLLCTGIPHLGCKGHKEFLLELTSLMAKSSGIRRTGSAALDLAYIANGRFDGFWESNLQIWDMAAGVLLIKEAGGLVTDKKGGNKIFEQKNIVCGNEYIHKKLLQIINEADKIS